MAERDPERKVWMLPADLSDRIKAYQQASGIPSEVEAARRLLDAALQMRDSVEDVLVTLRARFSAEKDLRVLARDVLTNHALVTEILFLDNNVTFKMRGGEYGSLHKNGKILKGDDPDHLCLFNPESPRGVRGLSRDAPKKADNVEDDNPF